MATQYNYFHGTAGFNKPYQPDSYGNYVFQLNMDAEELLKYTASGIQVEVKDNAVYFRRPHQKLIQNEIVTLGPPTVDDAEKKAVTKLIGAGSEVILKVRSYDTKKGIGHTLDHVRVNKLIEVDGSTDNVRYDF